MMPEGPETHVYSSQVASLLGAAFSTDYCDRREHTPEFKIKWGRPALKAITKIGEHNVLNEDTDIVCGAPCHMIWHCGKLTRFSLIGDRRLVVSYGMTGSWSLVRNNYSRVDFQFEGGNHLYFDDVRKFGRISIKDADQRCASVGLSMFSHYYIRDRLPELKARYPRRGLAWFINDPWICPGVGNYIRNEAMWIAKINPFRLVGELTMEELVLVIEAGKQVYTDSVNKQGMSMSDYRHIDGGLGSYQTQLNCYRKKQCPRCNGIIRRESDGDSSVYYCPECQPLSISTDSTL